jgi:hypothetical protein
VRNLIFSAFLLSITATGILFTEFRKNRSPAAEIQRQTYYETTEHLRSNHIPGEVFRMNDLRVLSITGMDCDYAGGPPCFALTEVPDSISRFQNLEELDLPVNAISSLPSGMRQLKKLRILNLADNPGLNITEGILPLQLEELYLYGCNQSALPEDITRLKQLKKLGLTGNNIPPSEITMLKKALPACDIISE